MSEVITIKVGSSEWYDSGLWNVGAAVAGALSLFALVIALVELARESRRPDAVIWDLRVTGTLTRSGVKMHVLELWNAGRGTGRIAYASFYGAELAQIDDFIFRPVIRSGERARVLATSHNLDAAWVLIVYTTDIDDKRVIFEWLPVTDAASAQARWFRSADRSARPWLVRKLRPNVARPVGPDYYVRASVRETNAEKRHPLVDLCAPPDGASGPAYRWGTAATPGVPFEPNAHDRIHGKK